MTKYDAVAAIHGDADAYVNPCVADGSGTRGTCGGGALVALDQVQGLHQE
jgi:hypothetical protein